jgi:pilus assembly protein CpaE
MVDNPTPEKMQATPQTAPPSSRPLDAMVFVKDPDSEGVIRRALGDVGVRNVEVINGSIAKAAAELSRRRSPRLLFVDVSGIDDPASELIELSEVCEPGTDVIVIGETNDIALYRQIKLTGIAEYFYKPLVSTLIVSACETALRGKPGQAGPRLGKLVYTMSLGGGAGATTLAVNTAWHLAERLQRQVVLVDLNIADGDVALQLNVQPTGALAEALEHPERIDDLFLQRAMIKVTDRLHVLATLQPLSGALIPDEKTVFLLLQTLLRRYRYVIVDMPSTLAVRLSGPLHLPSTLILVSNASLVAARDLRRWQELLGPNTPERSLLHVLNKARGDGGLSLSDFVAAAKQQPDVVIPYDRELGRASSLGITEMQKCSSFQRCLRPLLRRLTGEQDSEAPSFLSRILS